MDSKTEFWVGYKLQKDGSPICDGFKTQAEQDHKYKELERLGYDPVRLTEEGSRKWLMGQNPSLSDLTNFDKKWLKAN